MAGYVAIRVARFFVVRPAGRTHSGMKDPTADPGN